MTILARNRRYEVANYDNVAIPTNIDVSDATRSEFGAFYATLFDQTLAKHPRAGRHRVLVADHARAIPAPRRRSIRASS